MRIDDIQIFLITYNRANYLKESIESLLNQSIGIREITVLDNNSTDNTEEIVNQYANKGVKYVKTFGFLGNYKKAKELANKEYVILFHDDDILHPDYFKIALKLINKYKDISLITTRYTEFLDNNVPKFKKELSLNHYLFKTQKEFAQFMFFCEKIAYATAIYRTIDFVNTDLEYEKYNKFNDWPLMVKIAGKGKTILLQDESVFLVRRHSGQDTWTSINTPSIEQIINWDKLFYNIFNNSKDKILIHNYIKKSSYFLKGKYSAFISNEERNKYSFEEICNTAKNSGLKMIQINNSDLFEDNEFRLFIEYLYLSNLHSGFSQNIQNKLKLLKLRIKLQCQKSK